MLALRTADQISLLFSIIIDIQIIISLTQQNANLDKRPSSGTDEQYVVLVLLTLTMRVGILIPFTVCVALASSDIVSEFRIFNGNDAIEGQFPYQASIRSKHDNKHHCGAAILNNRFLLTAAHCTKFDYSKPDYVNVVVGALHRSNGGTKMDVDKITPHEDFDPWHLKNDIALIRTAKKINFNDQVQPIPLPTADIEDGKSLTITGWGKNGENSHPDLLQHIEVKTLDNFDCDKYFNNDDYGSFNIYSTNVCAIGTNKRSTCPGDSGMI